MFKTDNQPPGDVVVTVDPELADLVPGFLEHRKKDIKTMQAALAAGDYQTIRTLAHQMKGAGGGYGFDALTEIGGALERAATQGVVEDIRRWLCELTAYLGKVVVRYA